jgi:cysteine desulfurase family protein (TIGR01976 family)
MQTPSRDAFPIEWIRDRFPAVKVAAAQDPPFAFMDAAGGAQVPEFSLDLVGQYFLKRNVYHAGLYRRAREARTSLAEIRRRLAQFIGAASPDEVVFGLNATTLLSMFAASFGRLLKPGDEIVTTRLEHEANVTPWLRLGHAGVLTRFWAPRAGDRRLDLDGLDALLSNRTRLVAITGASNILGTITDIPCVARLVHDRGAFLLVDGVHLAPHRRINVRRDGIDAVFCSGYKIFGPHMGFGACTRELFHRLPSLNHRFLGDDAKLELGMQNCEGLAAMEGVLRYFAELAARLDLQAEDPYDGVFDAIAGYERMLSERLIEGLRSIKGVHVYGIVDPRQFDVRTPTAAITLEGRTVEEVARALGERGLGVNQGHMYAPRVIQWLGLADSGGVVRVSLCHYNTVEEVERLVAELTAIAG